jgi:hypothetical protein
LSKATAGARLGRQSIVHGSERQAAEEVFRLVTGRNPSEHELRNVGPLYWRAAEHDPEAGERGLAA